MPKRMDNGPVVFDVPPQRSLLAQVRQRAGELRARERAAYITAVCQTCGEIIALAPNATWGGHIVTVLQGLENAAGEQQRAVFARELQRAMALVERDLK